MLFINTSDLGAIPYEQSVTLVTQPYELWQGPSLYTHPTDMPFVPHMDTDMVTKKLIRVNSQDFTSNIADLVEDTRTILPPSELVPNARSRYDVLSHRRRGFLPYTNIQKQVQDSRTRPKVVAPKECSIPKHRHADKINPTSIGRQNHIWRAFVSR